jgi:leucyl/phenylalanyl-tRNA--protein transferase
MVSRVSGASKAALAALMHGLRNAGFELLDTQWKTNHLAQFGAIEISQRDYLFRLERALSIQRPFPRTFCLPGV